MPADRVLVTGGRGFVGGATISRLLASGTPVSLLTRHASRLPADLAERVEVVEGDFDAVDTIARALSRCRTVVHCAKSDVRDVAERRAIDVAGTTVLLEQAREAGVTRFIHLSSISVYPIATAACIDETSPHGASADEYSRGKRECEDAVLARSGDIDTVILQPANIYGPGRNWWSGELPDLMRKGRVILVDGGDGMANMVHVDDVAAAIELAVNGRGNRGARYLLTDGQPRPWREYYVELERVVGHPATVSMSVDEAKRYSRSVSATSPLRRVMRGLARKVALRSPLFALDDEAIDRFASRQIFVIDRARRELGYEPAVTSYLGRV